ncbi:NAD dependent epimerase/dehydratase family protein [Micromonospora sp. MW-13]|uniref:SaqR n=1 Tax=Micromonospora sp. Tu 6368 TaxID=428986 RepID=C4NYM2_9ACTN|nr:NAD-dependent epimerase/dehydratase family protein [Micromonospora sp. MW-13]ACP19376.1 SaqR [Micromonospora sp. Tu 6368]RGC65119.1 NAD dependent epimerase/dehydratase family protein [Micromonospora sp. MW-13]
MDIIGRGFLAQNLRQVADRHPDTVVLAAGVSWAAGTSAADFARESALLDEAARRCRADGRRLLFFSTAASGMYGAVRGPGREDHTVLPCTPYGAHKLALEEQLRASGADHLVLRLGHLVGPRQPPHQLVPTLVRQMRQGRVRLHRGAARDLIDVQDVVTILDRLLGLDLHAQTVNVASGEAVPVARIVDHLEQRLGLVAEREYRDVGVHHVISIDKLRRLVPEVEQLGFDRNYFRRVLDAYVASEIAVTDA